MLQSGLLELAHEKLHWPTPQEILEPSGAGPSVYARIAREKLSRTISKLSDGHGVQIGVLSANPQGDSTETPVALVCDFPTEISEETLRKTHQLAWSFSRTPSLITTEPNRLRIWTCYEEPPKEKDIINQALNPEQTIIAVIDCSFLRKSGKKTEGKAYFYNSLASKAEQGLEISVISIVEVYTHLSYSLSVQQTPFRWLLDISEIKIVKG